MKMVFDHDYHIHSTLSSCCSDDRQTAERILKYAEDNNLKKICITDHLWDSAVSGASEWYMPQNIEHISKILPLPKSDKCEFKFGCECELDKNLMLSLAKENFDKFDFIVIPTTHMHMKGLTADEEDYDFPERFAKHWSRRFSAVLDMDLPFEKIGIAHITCNCLAPKPHYHDVLQMIPDADMYNNFSKAASLGVGIELNYEDVKFFDKYGEVVLRPYRIAKECGCKFYFGTDAHKPDVFENCKSIFDRAVDILSLSDEDEFVF